MIITNTCTFGDFNHEMNVAARDHGLRFEEDHQMEWDDPNIPIFIPDGLDIKVKLFHDEILKFVVKMNRMICTPKLTHKELVNSFEANWKKHLAGELDVSPYFIKRRVL
jgi:hypothetical protein